MTRKEAERLLRQENTLMALGFTAGEAEQLRRISRTLQRWFERECGDGTDHASVAIERDEATGVPYQVLSFHNGQTRRYRIPDREAGARRRLAEIVHGRNSRGGGLLSAYVQTDPRGAALYILRPGDVPEGESVSAYYTRGICVY